MDPDPDIIDVFEIEEILDHKRYNGILMFLIKLKGYSEMHNSWEPEGNSQNCKESLESYERNRYNVGFAKL